jgi:hypothetical protein
MEPKWLARREERPNLVSIGTDLYEHDRDAFASVLGSAIALRLFLFIVPANLALVGAVGLTRTESWLEGALQASLTTGQLAVHHTGESIAKSLWLLGSGLVLTLWAGRALVRVLATCSASAWRLPATQAKVSLKGIAAISMLFFGFVAIGATFGRMRSVGGLPISVAAWLGVVATAAATWFAVSLVLPKATTDPGAVLPGAAVMGISLALLQWAMQIYLPARIARSEDTLGNLASTVATLGYFFFVGRLIAGTLVLNAFIFERWGSLSSRLFALPGFRRIPRRWPRVAEYFALDSPQR